MPFVANNEFLHGEHMMKESSFALHLLSTWLRFGANFFIFECFVQVIKGSRTTNVHYIGIFYNIIVGIHGVGKGWDLPLKSSSK